MVEFEDLLSIKEVAYSFSYNIDGASNYNFVLFPGLFEGILYSY